MEDREEGSTII